MTKRGLDRDAALASLEDGQYAEEVRDAERFWLQRGIQGVPAMVFAKRYLLTGAQGAENYAAALTQIIEQQAA